jgi:predicted RNA-binding Zn-ribbon protein involved in translation (DUF1610 family)
LTTSFCPVCGNQIYRSHSRGFTEKTIRVVTGYKAYRCHDCGWRGWLHKKKFSDRRRMMQTTIALLAVLMIVIVLTLYVVDRVASTPPPPIFPPE